MQQALEWLARRGAVVLLLGLLAAARLSGLTVAPVLTASMQPAFAPGAALVTREVPVADVRVGQVLVFTPPGHATRFAHRVVSVSGDPQHPTVTTKGDANPAADDWRVPLPTATVPEVVGSLPAAGRLLVLAHQPVGRSLLTGLLGLLLTSYAVRLVLVSGDSSTPALT